MSSAARRGSRRILGGTIVTIFLLPAVLFPEAAAIPLNVPPNAPTLLSPANNAALVSLWTSVRWQNNGDPTGDDVTHTVYLGTTNPPTTTYCAGTTATSCDAFIPLAESTTYFWKVRTRDSFNGFADSEVWSFSTVGPNNPPPKPTLSTPAHGSTGFSTSGSVSWQAVTDPDGDPVKYTVYLGTRTMRPYCENTTATTCNGFAPLYPGQWYNWRVRVTDARGGTNDSTTWTLTTAGTNNNTPPNAATRTAPLDGATGVGPSAPMTWTGNGDPDGNTPIGYTLYVGTIPSHLRVYECGESTSCTSFAPLYQGQDYWWKLQTYDDRGGSVMSDVWKFKTSGTSNNTPPNPATRNTPTNGASGVSTTTSVTWTSNGDPNVEDYVMHTVYLGGSTYSMKPYCVNTTLTSCSAFTPLHAGQVYHWKVVTTDSRGASVETSTGVFTTAGTNTNNPPGIAPRVSPTDGAVDVGTTVDLTWSAATDPNGDELYYVAILTEGGSSPPYCAGTQSLSCTVGPLAAGRTYQWRVRSVDARGDTNEDVTNWRFTTAGPNNPPNAPTLVSPADGSTTVNASSPSVSWTSNGDPDLNPVTHTVFLGTTNPPTTPYCAGTTATTCSAFTPLVPLTTYYWKVRTTDHRGASTDSGIRTFTTKANQAPLAATHGSPSDGRTDVNPNGVILTWTDRGDPDGDATTTTVWLGPAYHNLQPYCPDRPPADSWCGDIPSLHQGQWYRWKIVTKDVHGATAETGFRSFKTTGVSNNTPPNIPTPIHPLPGAVDVDPNTPFSWVFNGDPNGDSVDAAVILGTQPDYTFGRCVWTNATSCSEGLPLLPGQTYYYKFYLRDGRDAYVTGPEWTFTTAGTNTNQPPRAPTRVSPSGSGVSKWTSVTWTDNGDPDGDVVKHTVYLGGASYAMKPYCANTTATSCSSFTPLHDGQPYHWKVVTRDMRGKINSSTTGIFTTAGTSNNTGPTMPTRLTPTNGASGLFGAINFTWTASTDANGDEIHYWLYLHTSPNQWSASYCSETRATYCVVSGLEDGKTYYWKVQAYDSRAEGWHTSPEWTFTTAGPNTPPRAPTLVAPADGNTTINATAASVSWVNNGDPDNDLVSHTVYLGTTNPPTTPYCAGTTATTCSAFTPLAASTTYHWKVRTTDSRGDWNESATRSFTTKPNQLPLTATLGSPSEGRTDVSPNGLITTWTDRGDPDGDPTTTTVWLGPASHNLTAYCPDRPPADSWCGDFPTLHEGQWYRWKVVTKDNRGGVVETPLRSFKTTGTNTNNLPNVPTPLHPLPDAVDVDPNTPFTWVFNGDPDGDSVDAAIILGANPDLTYGYCVWTSQTSCGEFLPLHEGQTYYYQFYLRDGRDGYRLGPQWTFTTSGVSNNTPPNASTPLYPAQGEDGVSRYAANVTWIENGDPDGDPVRHTVLFGSATYALRPYCANTQQTTCTAFNPLHAGQHYWWKVVTTDSRGAKATTSERSFTTSGTSNNTPPQAPTSLWPAQGAIDVPTTATFTWQPSYDANSDEVLYSVYVSDTKNGWGHAHCALITTTSCTVTGLDPGKTYWWHIFYGDDRGEWGETPDSEFTLAGPNQPPHAPTLGSPANGNTTVNATAASVSWTSNGDPDRNPVTHTAYLDTSPSPTTPYCAGTTATTCAAFTPLAASTTYHWKVRTTDNRGGYSESEVRTFTTKPNLAPLAPTLQSPAYGATGVSPTGAVLTWNNRGDPDGDATTDTLYLGTNYYDLEPYCAGRPPSESWCTDFVPLYEGQKYWWKVVTSDNRGGTAESSQSWFQTSGTNTNVPPNAPTHTSHADGATNVDPNAPFTWTVNGDPDGNNPVRTTVRLATSASSPMFPYCSRTLATSCSDAAPLYPGQLYYYRLDAIDKRDAVTSTPVRTFTTSGVNNNSPPNAPTPTSPADLAMGVSRDTAVSWLDNGDPDPQDWSSFTVYLGPAPWTMKPYCVNTSSSSCDEMPRLHPGQEYHWRVRATDSRGKIADSPTIRFFTEGQSDNIAPPQPGKTAPSNGAIDVSTSATLSWNAVTDPNGDEVLYSVDVKAGTVWQDECTLVTQTSCAVGPLLAGRSYWWHVSSSDERGTTTGAYEADWVFTTAGPNTAPNAPTPVSPPDGAPSVDGATASVSWIANGDPDWNPVTHTVYLGTSNPPTTPYCAGTTSTSCSTFAPLAENATYYWRIRTTDNRGGWSESPVWSFKTLVTNFHPHQPARQSPTDGATTVSRWTSVTWTSYGDPDGDAVTHTVYLGTGNPPTTPYCAGTAGTSCSTFTPLAEGVQYFWKVRATDEHGLWTESTVGSFTTRPPNGAPYAPTPNSPANGATGVDTATSVTWTNNGDPDGDGVTHTVYFGTANPPTTAYCAGTTATSCNAFTPLSGSTTYRWKVRTTDSSGAWTESAVQTFTTVGTNTPPYQPIPQSPADGASGVSTTTSVTWTSNGDPNGDPVTHTVYLGTNNPPTTAYCAGTTATSCSAFTPLSPQTSYFWKVRTTDNRGAYVESAVRVFTTQSTTNRAPNAPSLVSPASGATGLSNATPVSWTSNGDPDGDAVTHTVFIGPTNPPTRVYCAGTTSTVCSDFTPLEDGAVVYWKIRTTDPHGAFAESAVRSFTTSNTLPTACFTVSPYMGTTTTTFGVDALCSHDTETQTADLFVRWDWNADGTYDTGWSNVLATGTSYATTGTKTIRLEVRDRALATATTTRTVSVVTAASEIEDHFVADFDDGEEDWTITGFWREVRKGESAYAETFTGNGSMWFGQEATGTYANGGSSISGILRSPEISLAGLSSPMLTFATWYETEDTGSTFDTKTVWVSNNNGLTWFFGGRIEGTAAYRQWAQYKLDLSSLAGSNILIDFEFATLDGTNNNFRGWYIDDVRIFEDPDHDALPFPEELKYGTDPNRADTDGDGLDDFVDRRPTVEDVPPSWDYLGEQAVGSIRFYPNDGFVDVDLKPPQDNVGVAGVDFGLELRGSKAGQAVDTDLRFHLRRNIDGHYLGRMPLPEWFYGGQSTWQSYLLVPKDVNGNKVVYSGASTLTIAANVPWLTDQDPAFHRLRTADVEAATFGKDQLAFVQYDFVPPAVGIPEDAMRAGFVALDAIRAGTDAPRLAADEDVAASRDAAASTAEALLRAVEIPAAALAVIPRANDTVAIPAFRFAMEGLVPRDEAIGFMGGVLNTVWSGVKWGWEEIVVPEAQSFVYGSDYNGRVVGDIVAGILVYGDVRDVTLGLWHGDDLKTALGAVGLALTFVGPQADGPYAAAKAAILVVPTPLARILVDELWYLTKHPGQFVDGAKKLTEIAKFVGTDAAKAARLKRFADKYGSGSHALLSLKNADDIAAVDSALAKITCLSLCDDVLAKFTQANSKLNTPEMFALAARLEKLNPGTTIVQDAAELATVEGVDKVFNNLVKTLDSTQTSGAKGYAFELKAAADLKRSGSQVTKLGRSMDITFQDAKGATRTAKYDIDAEEIKGNGHKIFNEFKANKKLRLKTGLKNQILKMEKAVDLGHANEARIIVKQTTIVETSVKDYARLRGIKIFDEAGLWLNP